MTSAAFIYSHYVIIGLESCHYCLAAFMTPYKMLSVISGSKLVCLAVPSFNILSFKKVCEIPWGGATWKIYLPLS